MSVAVPVVDTWDGVTRRIYLKQGVTEFLPIEDLYREYRNQRRLDENLRKFDALIRAEGMVPKGGGKFTPRYVVLLEGTKIIPYDETGVLTQNGEIITDDPDVDATIYDVSLLTVSKVVLIAPSEAEVIEIDVGGGSGASAQEVWEYIINLAQEGDMKAEDIIELILTRASLAAFKE